MRNLTLVLIGSALVLGGATAWETAQAAKGGNSPVQQGRSLLMRNGNDVDDNAKGRVDVRTHSKRNSVDLRVMAQRLDPDWSVDVSIEDGDNVEQTIAVGFDVNDDGAVKYDVKTGKGHSLPLGATSYDELIGRVVRVRRNGTGELLLAGRLPDPSIDPKLRIREKVDLTNEDTATDDDAKGRLRVQFRGRDGRSELRIDVKKVDANAPVSFQVANDLDEMVEVLATTSNDDGKARYRARTHQGDALPFDVTDIRQLSGRRVHVLVNGTVLLSGLLP